MQNLNTQASHFRLRDSGAGGVWRAVHEAPEYVAEEASEDFVERMSQQMWERPSAGSGPRMVVPFTAPESAAVQKAANHASWVGWDLAVAFAVHAAGMEPGAARERITKRCLDALQACIEAGHPAPPSDHADFVAVAKHPRFLELAAVGLRRTA